MADEYDWSAYMQRWIIFGALCVIVFALFSIRAELMEANGEPALFNATLTLDGEIDEQLKLVTGPGTCKSIIYNDPPAQFLIGQTLNDSVDVDTFNQTYYYELGSLLAGEPFFFHISELENPEHYACTQAVKPLGRYVPQIQAILPSEVENFDVWKHEHGGTVMLTYDPATEAMPKEFQ